MASHKTIYIYLEFHPLNTDSEKDLIMLLLDLGVAIVTPNHNILADWVGLSGTELNLI